jgi:hypothetical protein
VKLLVLHPQILGRTCADCRCWIYDQRHKKILRRGQPVARPAGVSTPCASCPKENSADGTYFDRHVADFAWLIRRRHEAIATGGACFSATERADPLLHRNLGVVEAVLHKLEIEQLLRHLHQLHAPSTPIFRRRR